MERLSVKKYFCLALIILVIGVIIGICIIKLSGNSPTSSIQMLRFNEIVNHNAGVALTILIIGSLTLGVGGLVILFINGISMGIVMGILSFKQIVFILFPYALFELLSFIFIAMAGIEISRNIKKFMKERKLIVLVNEWLYIRFLLTITLTLLAIAGLIEVYI